MGFPDWRCYNIPTDISKSSKLRLEVRWSQELQNYSTAKIVMEMKENSVHVFAKYVHPLPGSKPYVISWTGSWEAVGSNLCPCQAFLGELDADRWTPPRSIAVSNSVPRCVHVSCEVPR